MLNATGMQPSSQPTEPLRYGAMRLRWCGLALRAFLARWGVYLLVAAAVVGGGSANPLAAVAGLAAWLVLPLFWAASHGVWLAPAWCLQVACGAGLVWGARALLWSQAWGEAERALPLTRRDTLRSDALVVALVLSPLLLLYGLGAAALTLPTPAWLLPHRSLALLALAGVAAASIASGVLLLQAGRRGTPMSLRGNARKVDTTTQAAAPETSKMPSMPSMPSMQLMSAMPALLARGERPWPVALLLLPLWRGPAQRCGQALAVGAVTLCAVPMGLAWRPGWAGWWLAAFVVVSMAVTTRVATLARLGFADLHGAAAALPINPKLLHRARCGLALLPLVLGLCALAAVLLWAHATQAVGVRWPLMLLLWATVCVGNTVEALAPPREAAEKSSRWLLTLALGVACASEATR